MILSPFGNYVITKAMDVVPASSTCFVVEEFSRDILGYACHKFGIRILKHILTYHCHSKEGSPMVPVIIDTILSTASFLCFYKFGHLFFGLVVEYGKTHDRHNIVRILQIVGLLPFATDEISLEICVSFLVLPK